MDIYISIAIGIMLLETTYLVYRQTRRRRTDTNSVLLDTSVLIDGRIVEIARSGLMSARLVVPRSVVRELQFMADRADHDKRERARYGLDVIEKLQQIGDIRLSIVDDGATSEYGVDEQLIIIARRTGAKLCTIDYNLNKAARVQSVEVININELAHALRVNHLPGEKIDVELVQPGQDKRQAVGYLDDGTMVVVEDARDSLGKTIHVELTRVLQTAAGRMMFAKKHGGTSTLPKQTQGSVQKTAPLTPAEKSVSSSTKRPQTRPSRSQTSTAPQTSSQKPQAPKSAKTIPSPQSTRSGRGQRRQSPEDKLVNLANK